MSVTAAQVQVEIPSDIYRTAMYVSGVEVSGRMDALIANAALYTDDVGAQLILVCDAIYRLARIEPAKNPWADRANEIRKRASSAPVVPAYDSSAEEGGVANPEDEFSREEQDGL